MPYRIKPCLTVRGSISLPGDKSIAHRSVIISAIAQGVTVIKNFSFSLDCTATIAAMRSLGVSITSSGPNALRVCGVGLFGLKKPRHKIMVGESGTTMRILAGLLCGQSFSSVLDGKAALRRRPMLRVIAPLRLMGARITGRKKGENILAPLHIAPASLKGITWKMPIASAQVKSAILLAGLYGRNSTSVSEKTISRDHTERMLRYFDADISVRSRSVRLRPSFLRSPGTIDIPGDISSASFFIVLACLLKNSSLTIRRVSLNPSRYGLVKVLKKMGARITILKQNVRYFEPFGDLKVRFSLLKGVAVQEGLIPQLIDEIPILMVAAALAKGRTVFKGIGELRVKETDRIHSMVENLKRMGVVIETKRSANKEVIVIHGARELKGAQLRSFGDHRTAMSMIVAGLCARSPSELDDTSCIAKSFPDFLVLLKHLIVS